nr:ribonuclease 2 [Ipomoea batatas]
MASLLAKAKLILPLLLLLGIASEPLKAEKEFDYFTLALSWSGTKCLNVKECCSTNGCCNPNIGSKFTIRGFWPDYSDGTWPSCCNVKHGTCASPVLRNIYDYFSKALQLSSSFDVTGTLSESGFVASNSAKYMVGGIIQAIEKDVGVTPVLSCDGDAVKEVQLCFNRKFQIQECPTIETGMLSKSNECPGFVRLPIKTAPEKMNYLSLRGVQNW